MTDESGEEKVLIALTFSATPRAGELDPDMLYRVRIAPERETRLVYRRFQHASLTGRLGALALLDADIDGLLGRGKGRHADLWLLKAYVAVKLHRFAEAERFLVVDKTLAASVQGRLVQADVDVQFGRYDAARARIQGALAEDRSWDGLARLGYLHQTMGEFDAADVLYAEAEDELTAKQMHSFAWLALQRGAMYFSRGMHERAAMHYARADRAYGGYWLVEERVAELEGSQGKFTSAVARYGRLHAEAPRPEWERSDSRSAVPAGSAALRERPLLPAVALRERRFHYRPLQLDCWQRQSRPEIGVQAEPMLPRYEETE